MDDNDWETLVASVQMIAFLMIWIGSALAYGFLGFALGWLPALVISYFIGWFR